MCITAVAVIRRIRKVLLGVAFEVEGFEENAFSAHSWFYEIRGLHITFDQGMLRIQPFC